MKLLPWNIFQCGVASCETNFCENIWNYFSEIYETAISYICNLLFQWDMYWNIWNYFPEIYFNVVLQVVKLSSVKIYEITSLKYMKLLFVISVTCYFIEICIEIYEITSLRNV